MKTVKCKNPKTYNLVKGDIYEVNKETEDGYYVTNTKGLSAKYSKELFTIEAVIESVKEGIAKEVAAKPKLTEKQMIESIIIEDDYVRFKNQDGEMVSLEDAVLDVDSTEISCGIDQISGIVEVMDEVDLVVDGTSDDFLQLKKELFKKVVLKHLDTSRSMHLISTNVNDPDNAHYHAGLDEMAGTVSDVVNNPNSGNLIKLWILYTPQ